MTCSINVPWWPWASQHHFSADFQRLSNAGPTIVVSVPCFLGCGKGLGLGRYQLVPRHLLDTSVSTKLITLWRLMHWFMFSISEVRHFSLRFCQLYQRVSYFINVLVTSSTCKSLNQWANHFINVLSDSSTFFFINVLSISSTRFQLSRRAIHFVNVLSTSTTGFPLQQRAIHCINMLTTS